MTKAVAFGIVALGLIAVGCAPKPSLVGKWTGDMTVQGQTLSGNFEFTSDGKLKMNFSQGGIGIAVNSGYKLEGDQLTTTFESAEPVGEVPAMVKAMLDQAMKQMDQQKGKPEVSTVVFKDADTIEMTGSNGQKMTWTRVKAE